MRQPQEEARKKEVVEPLREHGLASRLYRRGAFICIDRWQDGWEA